MKRERKPVNKPVRFIEYLELLNLLPDNLDEFLGSFSVQSEKFQINEKTLGRIRAENSKRKQKGLDYLSLPPEKVKNIFSPEVRTLEKLYLEYFSTLPEKLKSYMRTFLEDTDWRSGERVLNMLAVERDSVDFLISQLELQKEFEKDFEDWKSTQDNEISNKELYSQFCGLMKHNLAVQTRYNAKKYELHIPSVKLIFLLPSINERLQYHRIAAGIERKGFKGFLTQLVVNEGFLDVGAQGLIGILIEQKIKGDASIEIDRLRRCEFCSKFVYSYKGNKRFCSEQCYAADYAQKKRNTSFSLLQKKLKKAIARLDSLESRLDPNGETIKEQKKIIDKLQNQINKEKD